MAKLDTLKNQNNEIIYPKTVQKAIYDDNGINLDRKVNSGIYNQIISSETEGNIPTLDNTLYNINGDIIYPKTTVENVEGIGSFIENLSYSKVGTVHKLSGLNRSYDIVSAVFTATENYTSGDTITIDDIEYSIQLSDGGTPSDNLFVAGCTIPIIVDSVGKKVNFKSGGDSGGYQNGDIIAAENFELTGTFSYDSKKYTSLPFDTSNLLNQISNDLNPYEVSIRGSGVYYNAVIMSDDNTFYVSTTYPSSGANNFSICKVKLKGNLASLVYKTQITNTKYLSNICAMCQSSGEEDVFFMLNGNTFIKANIFTGDILISVPVSSLFSGITVDTSTPLIISPDNDVCVYLYAVSNGTAKILRIRKEDCQVMASYTVPSSYIQDAFGICYCPVSNTVLISGNYNSSSNYQESVIQLNSNNLSFIKRSVISTTSYNPRNTISSDQNGCFYMQTFGTGNLYIVKLDKDLNTIAKYQLLSQGGSYDNNICFLKADKNIFWFSYLKSDDYVRPFIYAKDTDSSFASSTAVSGMSKILIHKSSDNSLYSMGFDGYVVCLQKIVNLGSNSIKVLEVLK